MYRAAPQRKPMLVRVPSEEILISASAAAWVEVVSENGDVLLSKLFQPGDDFIAPANQKLYLSTGNAGGLVCKYRVLMNSPLVRLAKSSVICR